MKSGGILKKENDGIYSKVFGDRLLEKQKTPKIGYRTLAGTAGSSGATSQSSFVTRNYRNRTPRNLKPMTAESVSSVSSKFTDQFKFAP